MEVPQIFAQVRRSSPISLAGEDLVGPLIAVEDPVITPALLPKFVNHKDSEGLRQHQLLACLKILPFIRDTVSMM